MKKSEIRQLKVSQLKDELRSRGKKVAGTKEELVDRLIKAELPVYELPKFRRNSVRGVVVRAYVDEKGESQGSVATEFLAAHLMSKFGLTETKARQAIKFYHYNLERYWGYDKIIDASGKIVRFEKRD